MMVPALARLIRFFALYGGLFFTVIRQGVLIGMTLLSIHLFLVTVVPVWGDSMVPTINAGSYMVVDTFTLRFRPLRRGEIVAFRHPQDPRQKLLKRVVGIPGDVLVIRTGRISLTEPTSEQFVRLAEPYLPPETKTTGEVQVFLGPDEYFILGDNRQDSYDSRSFGPVGHDHIIGQAWFLVWPWSERHLLSESVP